MSQNETRRHFDLRDLDNDMKRASEKAARVVPKETARRLRAESWGLLFVLLILLDLLAFALGLI